MTAGPASFEPILRGMSERLWPYIAADMTLIELRRELALIRDEAAEVQRRLAVVTKAIERKERYGG